MHACPQQPCVKCMAWVAHMSKKVGQIEECVASGKQRSALADLLATGRSKYTVCVALQGKQHRQRHCVVLAAGCYDEPRERLLSS